MSKVESNDLTPDPHSNPWVALSISAIENDVTLLPFCRRLYLEAKKNKGYAHIGKFFQSMSDDELTQLKIGLTSISENINNIYANSAFCFMTVIAYAEGSPCLFVNEIKQNLAVLALLVTATIAHRQDYGTAVFDNFKITGFSSWDIIFMPKENKINEQNKSTETKEDPPKDPTEPRE